MHSQCETRYQKHIIIYALVLAEYRSVPEIISSLQHSGKTWHKYVFQIGSPLFHCPRAEEIVDNLNNSFHLRDEYKVM